MITNPDFSRAVRPISELVVEADFPKNALGEYVDVGGYAGVVIDVVHHSLKVRSPEGVTKSYNVNGLRKIYGPVVRPEPIPEAKPAPPARPEPNLAPWERTPEVVVPKREVITEPDFTKPVKNIADWVTHPNYPKCLFGEHIEIGGYTGVVV